MVQHITILSKLSGIMEIASVTQMKFLLHLRREAGKNETKGIKINIGKNLLFVLPLFDA